MKSNAAASPSNEQKETKINPPKQEPKATVPTQTVTNSVLPPIPEKVVSTPPLEQTNPNTTVQPKATTQETNTNPPPISPETNTNSPSTPPISKPTEQTNPPEEPQFIANVLPEQLQTSKKGFNPDAVRVPLKGKFEKRKLKNFNPQRKRKRKKREPGDMEIIQSLTTEERVFNLF